MTRWFLLLGALISVSAWAAGDPAAGKALYTVCSACHGQQAEGMQALNAPKLAGQAEWYLKRQIQNFKAGLRGSDPADKNGAQMVPMMAMLTSEAAIDNVVAYIATLPDTPAPVTVQGDAAHGKALYATCAACHGAKGEGNEALKAPRQAGMTDWYMVTQLKNFKQGIRGKSSQDTFGMQMAPMAAMLADDQAINDVVAYINTLR
jgi:cytochrome c oxidase subunit 2